MLKRGPIIKITWIWAQQYEILDSFPISSYGRGLLLSVVGSPCVRILLTLSHVYFEFQRGKRALKKAARTPRRTRACLDEKKPLQMDVKGVKITTAYLAKRQLHWNKSTHEIKETKT